MLLAQRCARSYYLAITECLRIFRHRKVDRAYNLEAKGNTMSNVVYETLRKMYDFFSGGASRWTQGHYAVDSVNELTVAWNDPDADAYCIMGCFYKMTNKDIDPSDHEMLIKALFDHMPDTYQHVNCDEDYENRVINYNDSTEMDYSKMMRWLDRTIQDVEPIDAKISDSRQIELV